MGASLLAKAMDQARCFLSIYGPFREQARSHSECVWQALRRLNAVSKTTVGASLLAKAIDQARCFLSIYGPFREQARSHRECVWQALRRVMQ
ncbi:hypothetical protein DA456_16160 [Pseudomonas syringae pv. atrofaciens]|uniref:Uncharacterized protein n=1 Tax=Pseudomonas syringae pv. atrofaciens TaxID=192087 RepID=A0AAD0I9H6_PSESX|nr:hypothetical protein DA456_16160 [Pseudomonas syringae pv. atrofaciens]